MDEAGSKEKVLGSKERRTSGPESLLAEEVDAEELDQGLVAAKKVAEAPPESDKEGKFAPEDQDMIANATEWMLRSFDAPPEVEHTIDLNVGTAKNPTWLPWKIRAVDGSLIRRIRAKALETVTERGRAAGAAANAEAAYRSNLEVIVEGTVEPDLRQVAMARSIADPTIILEGAFRNKQGLVDNVAGQIFALSGYDEEDVRDHLEQTAARSS